MRFLEDAKIEGTAIRRDGYLVVDARVARTGIQHYLGSEIGSDKRVVNVYRSPEEVFSDETMRSLAHIPITDDHPKESVTADNWKEHARGHTADEVKQEGKFIRVPLMVADGSVIKKIDDGKRELSVGYTCDLVWGDGVSPDGETYHAKQTNIRANHIAVVERGRAGKDVRIGDSANEWGAAPITDAETKGDNMSEALRKVMVDGFSVNTTDEGATAITKLVADRDSLQAKIDKMVADHAKALADKDKELATKDAKIDDLSKKALDQKAIDKLVSDRSALETLASKIAKDVKATGLSDADLRKAVVVAKLGDAAVKDKSETYIDARFDILAEGINDADPFRDAMRSGVKSSNTVIDEREKAFADLQHFDATGKEVN